VSLEHPYTVVVAGDLSEITDAVIQHAFDVASHRGDVDLHILTVLPTGRGLFHRSRDHGGELSEIEDRLRPRVAEALAAFADQLDRFDGWRVHVHVRAGQPSEEIVDLIDEARADLVVMGRHGWDGVRHGLVGSVSERVLRLGHCSVLLVQPPDYEPEEAEEDVPCADCVRIRHDSRGEQWFCERHHARGRMGHLVLEPGSALKPGGLF